MTRQRSNKNAFRRWVCLLLSLVFDAWQMRSFYPREWDLLDVENIIAPYFSAKLCRNIHLFAEKAVWKDSEEKQLWHKIKKGLSKLPAIFLFEIKNGIGYLVIWTDRWITAGTQCNVANACITDWNHGSVFHKEITSTFINHKSLVILQTLVPHFYAVTHASPTASGAPSGYAASPTGCCLATRTWPGISPTLHDASCKAKQTLVRQKC